MQFVFFYPKDIQWFCQKSQNDVKDHAIIYYIVTLFLKIIHKMHLMNTQSYSKHTVLWCNG